MVHAAGATAGARGRGSTLNPLSACRRARRGPADRLRHVSHPKTSAPAARPSAKTGLGRSTSQASFDSSLAARRTARGRPERWSAVSSIRPGRPRCARSDRVLLHHVDDRHVRAEEQHEEEAELRLPREAAVHGRHGEAEGVGEEARPARELAEERAHEGRDGGHEEQRSPRAHPIGSRRSPRCCRPSPRRRLRHELHRAQDARPERTKALVTTTRSPARSSRPRRRRGTSRRSSRRSPGHSPRALASAGSP